MKSTSVQHLIASLSVARERFKQIQRNRKVNKQASLTLRLTENVFVVEQSLHAVPEKLSIFRGETECFSSTVSSVNEGSLFRVSAEISIPEFFAANDQLIKEMYDLTELVPINFDIAWVYPLEHQGSLPENEILTVDGTIVSRSQALQLMTDEKTPHKLHSIQWAGHATHSRQDQQLRNFSFSFPIEARVTHTGRAKITIDPEPQVRFTPFADGVGVSGNKIHVSGRLNIATGRPGRVEIVWKSRFTGIEIQSDCSLRFDEKWSVNDGGRQNYIYQSTTEFHESLWDSFTTGDVYDAFVRVTDADTEAISERRLARVPYFARLFTSHAVTPGISRSLALVPYYTFKAKALSVQAEQFSGDITHYLSPSHNTLRKLRSSRVLKRPVWLIGELPYKAQDNGLHFFRWMRKNHPEIDAYYVIQEDSPEVKNLEGLDHVLAHGSPEHFEKALQASHFIGTHHPDYLYPSRNPAFVSKLKGTRVFLQHGVMATKWMVPNYGKNAPGFTTDLFFCSSEYEKSYLVRDFGYDPDEVIVTGLSRFDRLLADHPPIDGKNILVMPTWRDWLQTAPSLTETEYFIAWSSLLRSPRFRELLSDNQTSITVCLHPNMQKYSHQFEGLGVRVVYQGEVDVQTLMIEHSCMITDYSSVGFDFSFLERPVIYYQFDREQFIGKFGSHIDLDAELPGFICFDQASVISHIEQLIESDFEQPSDLKRRSEKFLDHRDTNNNQRVYDSVLKFKRKQARYIPPAWVEMRTVAYNWFRRSRFYFPSMKVLFAFGAILPRTNTTVFESHNGKQFSDSPRYIYEELALKDPDSRKVWVHHLPLPHKHPNTQTVKRLSPRYFWELSRANTWVFNQNLPYYIKRPKNTYYLQTWHGTPLKKMQHDLNQIHGRDDGYLGRVHQATSQWSTLISPSPYASGAFRSAFRYEGEIAEIGYPRNDILIEPSMTELRNQLRARFSLEDRHKVILYAPTFRDDQYNSPGKFTFELPLNLERFHAEMDEDTLLFLRLHSAVSSRLVIPEHLQYRVKNVSTYSESQELLLVSDALITDYSSIFFDAALLDRPILFYAYDLENYRDALRGFYLEYPEALPGPVVEHEKDLWLMLSELLKSDIDRDSRQAFNERFNPFEDGNSARRAVDLILKHRKLWS